MRIILILTSCFLFVTSNAQTQGPVFSLVKTKNIDTISSIYLLDTVPEGRTVRFSFFFTNSGNHPLILQQVKSSCGCMVASWPKAPIMPMDTAEIKVTLSTAHRSGPLQKTLTVVSNSTPEKNILRVKGVIQPKRD